VGREFLFLIPSTAVVRLDDVTARVLDAFQDGPRNPAEVVELFADRFPREDLVDSVVELNQMGALVSADVVNLIPTFNPTPDPQQVQPEL
jgi:hypothetical protein